MVARLVTDIDGAIVAYAVRKPLGLIELQRAGITAEHLTDDYQTAWNWILKIKRTHGQPPSLGIVQSRFADLDLSPARSRDVPLLVSEIKKRKKFIEFHDALEFASSNANSVDDIDAVMSELQSRINSLHLNREGQALVDMFSRAAKRRMLQDLRARKRGKSIGIPTGLHKFDYVTGGLVKRKMIVVMARTGVGKAQPLNAKVLTPSGWKTMGDLKVGDEVLTPSGAPSRIVAVHPQGKKAIYRVTTSDGASTEATADHLWLTETRNERRYGTPSVKTTKEIAASLRNGSYWNHYLPLIEPMEGTDQNFPIDPYVLGAFIGDGHARHKKDNGIEVLMSSNDPELIAEMNSLLDHGEFVPTRNMNWRYTWGARRDSFRIAIKEFGLCNAGAQNKSIPDEYLRGSAKTRLSVLQGLLDTDGTPVRASAEFCTTSSVLADQVTTIVRSLGGTARTVWRTTRFTNSAGVKQDGLPSARIYITLPEGMEYFRLERKQSLVTHNQKKNRAIRTIRKVELVRRAEAKCITINSDDQLYVTDDYLVTHNSWMNLLFVAAAVMNGQKVILYPLEMTFEETALRLYTIFSQKMFGPSKVLKNLDLTMGRFKPAKVRKLLDILEDRYSGQLLVADIASLADPYTVSRIEADCELHKPDMFWIDYLTLMKAEGSRQGNEDYTTIKQLSNGVKGIAQRQNCVGGASVQVNREAMKVRSFLPRVEHISYGDSIGHDADNIVSVGKKEQNLFYQLVKNRGGPETGRVRLKAFFDEGIITEDENQQEDEDE